MNSVTQRFSRFRMPTSRHAETPANYPRILLCRITQKAQLFAAFVPLQRKTQCLWQKLIAKAAKAVMSTEQSEWRYPGGGSIKQN